MPLTLNSFLFPGLYFFKILVHRCTLHYVALQARAPPSEPNLANRLSTAFHPTHQFVIQWLGLIAVVNFIVTEFYIY
ncbi:hypothetical protein P692DRAFT_20138782 [Suillus brevipes Sb2]|nr:hypothetical protein P692DRAFT_20138782 [Suillus brevipes Sb2]